MTSHGYRRGCQKPAIDRATVARVTLLALALGVTAVAAAVGGLMWPQAQGGGETYTYADIAPDRELWWGLLGGLAVVGLVNVPLQAMATMFLVRERGSAWATVGGSLMWVGIGLQATGVAGWASAYYYPTDPGLDRPWQRSHRGRQQRPGAPVRLPDPRRAPGRPRNRPSMRRTVPGSRGARMGADRLALHCRHLHRPGQRRARNVTSIPMAVGAIGWGTLGGDELSSHEARSRAGLTEHARPVGRGPPVTGGCRTAA